jgi:hypothetical protein
MKQGAPHLVRKGHLPQHAWGSKARVSPLSQGVGAGFLEEAPFQLRLEIA